MAKIKAFFQKNYTWIIAVSTAILVIIGSIILIKVLNKNAVKQSMTKIDAYQYFITNKNTFELDLKYENDNIVSLIANNYTLKDNLIYSDDLIIFNKEYQLVDTNQNGIFYKILPYSYIKDHYLYVDGQKNIVNNVFAFDGENTYFFFDNATLNINDESIEIPKNSYIWSGSESLLFYNVELDTIKEYKVKNANVKYKNIYIDLFNDTMINQSKMIMLKASISNLDIYKEN